VQLVLKVLQVRTEPLVPKVPLAKMVRRANQALQVLLENEVNKVLQGEMVVMEKMETTSLRVL
jgi:hypothetical protein